MTVENVTRRRVLRGVVTGAAATGMGTEAFAQASDRKIVGLEASAGFGVAREKADSVHRELDFGDVGKAVAGTFSEEALSALENNPKVRYVELDGTVQALAQTLPWGVDRVDADVAHSDGVTGSGADVAIIDTGIDADHADLQANVGTGKDFTGTGSWDDDNGHGSHCAGIADAVDNSEGVVGVSTEATLHAAKVLDQYGYGSWSDVAAGIEWVADQGYDVGSLSLGGSSGSSTLKDACQYANDRGVLLVAAAGNSGPCTDCVSYPAKYSTVLAVSATTSSDSLAGFSSQGPEVELAAPGKDVYSTWENGQYATKDGTSMACPHVSGAGGALMANGYSSSQARSRLKNTAEDVGLSSNEQGAGLLDAEAAAPSPSTGGAFGEVGTVTTDQPDTATWHQVSFDGSYDDPVVVAKPVSYDGGDPCHVRVRSVGPSGFEFQLEEWNYLDGQHTTETITYLVVESGVHTLPDGRTIEADTIPYDGSLFYSTSFAADFDTAPVSFAQIQTTNESLPLVTRQRNLTADGVEVSVQEEEAESRSFVSDTIGYVAVQAGSGTTGGDPYEFGVTPDVDENWSAVGFSSGYSSPAFLADMQTYNGGNPAGLRYRNLDGSGAEVFVEEERSADDETNHAAEDVSVAAFEDGAKLYPKVAGEVGTVTTDQPDASTWHQVSFDGSYDDPVVVAKPVSYDGGNPCHVRVRSVGSSGFEFQLEEWNYLDGQHTTETITYLVVESGVHTLPDGRTIEADTVAYDGVLFDSTSFAADFDAAPVSFAQVQTTNESLPLVTRQRNLTADGVEVSVQEEEAEDRSDLAETIGYVAVEVGNGDLGGDSYEFGVTTDVDENWSSFGFANSYGSPALLADMRTYNGGNPAGLRYRNLDGSGAEVFVEEEQSADDETSHAAEDVSFAAFEAGTKILVK